MQSLGLSLALRRALLQPLAPGEIHEVQDAWPRVRANAETETHAGKNGRMKSLKEGIAQENRHPGETRQMKPQKKRACGLESKNRIL